MASNGPENKGPSIAELQRFVREQVKLEFWLVTGKTFQGTLRWYDEYCYSLVQEDGGAITLMKSGVVGYKPVKPGSGKQPSKK
jgi:sRNA-binding regulator protein Hfq